MENVNQLIIMFTPVHTSFTLLKSNYRFTDPFIQNRNGKSLSGKTLLPCYLQPNLLLFSSIIVNQGRSNFYKINFYSLIRTAVLCLCIYSINRVHIHEDVSFPGCYGVSGGREVHIPNTAVT